MTAAIAALLVAGAGYLHLYQPAYVRSVLEGTPLAPSPTLTHAYKWRGEDGTWQITTEPPPAGTAYERITVRSDTNIVPSISTAD